MLTNNQKALIQYVVKNDLKTARTYAKFILESNKTKADEVFCNHQLAILKEQETKGIEIPMNLQGILQTECSAYPFIKERYFLSNREREALEHIQRMNMVASRLEEEFKIHYCNSMLLCGQSGTGKTTFARYVASELQLPFFYLNMTQVMSSLLGKTGQNLDLVFHFVGSVPCVFVIDEIDVIGISRTNDNSRMDGEMNRVLVSIMQNLDMLPNKTIVIAASNRPEAIDKALNRRFTKRHDVQALSADEAQTFVQHYIQAIGLQYLIDNWVFENNQNYTPAYLTTLIHERMAECILDDYDKGGISHA